MPEKRQVSAHAQHMLDLSCEDAEVQKMAMAFGQLLMCLRRAAMHCHLQCVGICASLDDASF